MSYVKTLSVQQRQDASAAVRKLLEDGPQATNCGVCYNLALLLGHVAGSGRPHWAYFLVAEISPSWPHYSGSRAYPVPTSAGRCGEWEGEALTLRRSLLKHMLAELELAE